MTSNDRESKGHGLNHLAATFFLGGFEQNGGRVSIIPGKLQGPFIAGWELGESNLKHFFDVFYPETLGDMIPGECAYFSVNGWRKSHQPVLGFGGTSSSNFSFCVYLYREPGTSTWLFQLDDSTPLLRKWLGNQHFHPLKIGRLSYLHKISVYIIATPRLPTTIF